MADLTMDKLVALCKNRGLIFAGSELYGGLANTWDYGPLGVEFKNNVKKAWWQKFVQESKYNVGLDCAILMNREVWVASGHVGGFNDPLMDCKDCKTRHRADKLIEDFTGESADGWTNEQMQQFIVDNNIACPECGGAMKHIGVGTQRAEEELHALFPEAEILRMDADTVSQGHEKILRDFQVRRVPILLGTQMVAKGLDFANVTLVGVLAADMSLYVDHYRASERTFSLLTQVVGRAGRGDKPGRAVIQTYTPQNDVILAAADQDYDRFYDGEIRLRQLRRDPPFADQFFITVTGPQEGPVRRAAAGLRDGLRSAAGQEPYRGMALDILGPAPAPVVKVNNRYRYRVTVIGRNDKTLRGLLSAFMKEFSRRPEHKALHIYTDCNLMD